LISTSSLSRQAKRKSQTGCQARLRVNLEWLFASMLQDRAFLTGPGSRLI